LSAASKGKCDKPFAFRSQLVLLTPAPYFDSKHPAILPISEIILERLLIFGTAERALSKDLLEAVFT